MASCKYCSAPLPKSSIICEYCGVRNDIEVISNTTSLLPKSRRTCPDCLIYLDSIDIGKNSTFIIEKCSRCFGLFFDLYELEKLVEKPQKESYWINHKKLQSLLQHPLHKDTVQYRKCPECNKFMHRINYSQRSGIIMDTCSKHGIWLDAGELKQMREWIALGGKKRAQEQDLQEGRSSKRGAFSSTSSQRSVDYSTYGRRFEKENHTFLEIVDAFVRTVSEM